MTMKTQYQIQVMTFDIKMYTRKFCSQNADFYLGFDAAQVSFAVYFKGFGLKTQLYSSGNLALELELRLLKQILQDGEHFDVLFVLISSTPLYITS
jgi:hypothetical protein